MALKQPAVIIGPGQQGLAGVIVAKESGAEPIIVVGLEADAERLELARRMGADVTVMADREDPVEAVKRATGGLMGAVFWRCAAILRRAQRHKPGRSWRHGGFARALRRGHRGASQAGPGHFQGADHKGRVFPQFLAVEPAIKIARSGKYPLEEMISHRFPLEKAEDAVRLVAGEKPKENPIKVVIAPWA